MGTTGRSEWLTTTEAAEVLGVNPRTIIRWANAGKLRQSRTPGGHRRFKRADLVACFNDGAAA